MEIKAFKPGQTVYIMGTDRRDRGDHAARKAEVAKVGRKYVTISGRWGERFRETVGRSKPYLIEEMEYGSPRLLFPSEAAARENLCTTSTSARASSETSPSTFGTGCAITAGRLIPERVSGTYLYKLKEDKHMSELTLRFGEARLHVEGDADLVARERAAFLEHLGRLDRQSEKAGELLAVLLRAGRAPEKAEEPVSKKAEPEEPAEEKSTTQDDLCRLRSIHVGFVSPSQLKRAKAEGKLDHLLAQRDEIEVPLDTGGTVTVVCCYVSPTSARFVFKDCWDEGVMNDEATNKTGYFKSKGRKHVLEDIYPHIAAEWREIIVPRTFVETIEGERVEYSDPLWLPSATDVFGTPDGAWWNDGDDDFQLPVFTRERDRVKECGDKGTYSWWLRSVDASYTYSFCFVGAGGSAFNNYAYYSCGFAPGFDI